MFDLPEEEMNALSQMMKNFGIKSVLEIRFTNPKKVLVKFDDKDTVRENITKLEVLSLPDPEGECLSVDISSATDSVSSNLKWVKGITILD